MRTIIPALMLVFGLAVCHLCPGADLYVSPAGDDANPGTPERPLATLAAARDAVRALKASPERPRGPIVVEFGGGLYCLEEPVVFTPEDSGSEGAPIIYQAVEGETPIVSGGVPVSGWRPEEDGLWVAEVPWAAERGQPFTQLFVNGQRRPRARTPNAGEYFYTRRLLQTDTHGSPCHGMVCFPEDLGPWVEDEGALICLMHNWVNSYNRVGQVDRNRNLIRFARPAGVFFLGPSVRYYVENCREALDSPGEWYLDHGRGLLYYRPLPGEDMVQVEVMAPRSDRTVVYLTGDSQAGLYCEHLVFRGLAFRHTDADLSPDYMHSVQGAVHQRGAVFASGARDCTFEDCEFSNLGEHAISLREGCRGNTVTRCHIHDLGGGGVYLSEGGPLSTDDWYLTADNTVDNNIIHDGGHIFASACGVFLGGSASYNRITRNEICDLSWVGVHLGWSWSGRDPAYTHHNEVGGNHIHHIGNGVLNDIGGIYTLGVSPGTVLHHNVIHDVTRFERGTQGYGGWGIYLDAGSSEIVIENNVVYDTRDGGLHLHCYSHPYGDIARNNIFAYSAEGQLMRNANHEPDRGLHATLERNIVYNEDPRMLWGSNWAPESKFASDYNCYFSEDEAGADFNGAGFAEWQATGRDLHSIVADPGFVDAAGRDFRLREGSPAVGLGFVPIDFNLVGVYGSDEWVRLTESIVHRSFEAAPPPDLEAQKHIVWDFEEYEPGEMPEGSAAAEGATSVMVTDQQPAAGIRCLKLVEGEASNVWKPHWFVARLPGTGAVNMTCSVRNDAQQPVQFDLEFRDWPAGTKYTTGPHLRFLPDGSVQAVDGTQWRTIGGYELGHWLAVQVRFQEGPDKEKTYSVRLGETAEPIEGLRFYSEGSADCTWVGFAGMGVEPGVFYVDEVRVE